MLKTAFYIVARPSVQGSSGESKEPEGVDHGSATSAQAQAAHAAGPSFGASGDGGGNHDANYGLAPMDKWAYCEEVSLEYASAQSTLHKVYGNKIQETGHRTEGHVCVRDEDRDVAKATKGSLLYGELLPRGVNRALDSKHLDASRPATHTLLDLGMGTGKVVLQVFLQCPNLTHVYGVELSPARFRLAEAAALRLVDIERLDDGPERSSSRSSLQAAPHAAAVAAAATAVAAAAEHYSGPGSVPSECSSHGSQSGGSADGHGPSDRFTPPGPSAGSSAAAARPPRGVPRFEVVEHVAGQLLKVRDRVPRRDGKPRILTLEWNNLLDAPPKLVRLQR